jgi:hypothetical protein
MVDYSVTLTIGDLRKNKKLTFKEIAKRVNPRGYRENPESTTRNVAASYERYRELVDGGYRDLTYP